MPPKAAGQPRNPSVEVGHAPTTSVGTMVNNPTLTTPKTGDICLPSQSSPPEAEGTTAQAGDPVPGGRWGHVVPPTAAGQPQNPSVEVGQAPTTWLLPGDIVPTVRKRNTGDFRFYPDRARSHPTAGATARTGDQLTGGERGYTLPPTATGQPQPGPQPTHPEPP